MEEGYDTERRPFSERQEREIAVRDRRQIAAAVERIDVALDRASLAMTSLVEHVEPMLGPDQRPEALDRAVASRDMPSVHADRLHSYADRIEALTEQITSVDARFDL